jgi:hypothetical protein
MRTRPRYRAGGGAASLGAAAPPLIYFLLATVMRICCRAALKPHVRHNDSAKFLDRKQGDA